MAYVKSTINISEHLRKELDKYIALKVVPTFSYAVNTAIENYLFELRKAEYDRGIEEAAKDPAFVERMSKCQSDFAFVDSEVLGEW
jgi:metal-responsive CopG/Arc/MetJ family transcriptional regulator